MNCKHVYEYGTSLQNLRSNGITTNPSRWKDGEGLHRSKKARLIEVHKCGKCGHSIPTN